MSKTYHLEEAHQSKTCPQFSMTIQESSKLSRVHTCNWGDKLDYGVLLPNHSQSSVESVPFLEPHLSSYVTCLCANVKKSESEGHVVGVWLCVWRMTFLCHCNSLFVLVAHVQSPYICSHCCSCNAHSPAPPRLGQDQVGLLPFADNNLPLPMGAALRFSSFPNEQVWAEQKMRQYLSYIHLIRRHVHHFGTCYKRPLWLTVEKNISIDPLRNNTQSLFCVPHPFNVITLLLFVSLCYRKGSQDQISQTRLSKTRLI